MIRVKIFKCSLAAISVIFLAAAAGHAQDLDTLKLQAEADSLKAQADSLRETYKDDEALPLYQSALANYQQIGDKAAEAQVFDGIGKIYHRKWRFNDAISSFESRLSLEQELGNRKGEAEALISLGKANYSLQHSSTAADLFHRSLEIARELGDRHLEALSLNGLSYTHDLFAEFDSTLTLGKMALKISQEMGDRSAEAEILDNLGQIYLNYSDITRALDCDERSLGIFRELGDLHRQSYMFYKIGFAYSYLGDESRALEYYQQGLDIVSQLGDSAGINRLLGLMGMSYHNRQEYGRALDCYQQAYQFYQSIGYKVWIRVISNLLGRLYTDLAEFDKALPYYQYALALAREAGDQYNEALTLARLGDLYLKQGNYAQAMAYHQEALAIRKKGGIQGFPEVFEGVARCYAAQGLDSLAIAYYEKAAEIADNARGQMQMESYKSSWASSYSRLYEGLILALLKSGRSEQAFHCIERGRARSFLDLLASAQVKVGKPVHQDFLAQENQYQKEKQRIEEQITQAGDDSAQVVALRGKLEGDWGQVLASLEETKREEPELASLVSVNPLTLPEVQKLLDKETALLEYFLTEKKTLIWLITQKQADVFQVEIGGDSLKTLVIAFRKAIESQGRPDLLSRKLYDLLLARATGKIKTENLIIVPHGILHYLPFATLQDAKGRCLLEDYCIRYLPSASVLKYLAGKRKGRGETVLALGNPATDRQGYGAIPLTETEVKQIGVIFPHGRVLTGPQATEEEFKRLAPECDILHLACHGDLNSAYPMFSCLLLTPDSLEDGELAVHEIFNLDLNANLVVLSGCQTGLGHLTNGDELVGLTRAFIYAGTPSIVSSLWMVEDESTAYLMERFYSHLQTQDKAQALRQAQLETRQKYPGLRSWASFVLTGEAM